MWSNQIVCHKRADHCCHWAYDNLHRHLHQEEERVWFAPCYTRYFLSILQRHCDISLLICSNAHYMVASRHSIFCADNRRSDRRDQGRRRPSASQLLLALLPWWDRCDNSHLNSYKFYILHISFCLHPNLRVVDLMSRCTTTSRQESYATEMQAWSKKVTRASQVGTLHVSCTHIVSIN